MKKENFLSACDNAPFGYAVFRVIRKDTIDFEPIETNSLFHSIVNNTQRKLISSADFLCEYFREAAASSSSYTKIIYVDHLIRWYDLQAYMSGDDLLTAVFTDVTDDQKRIIDFERMFTVAHLLQFRLDIDGRFEKFGSLAEELSGYESASLIGKKWIDFVYADDLAASQDMLALLIQAQNEIRFTNRCLHRDGSYHWVDWTMRVYDNHIYASARDVTAYKNTEDMLREISEQHRILLEESPDPLFSFTSQGVYRFVNKAFAEGVGKTVAEILGHKIGDVFPKEEAEKRYASLRHVFETGEEKVIEVRVPRSDGDRFYITTIFPIKNQNGAVDFVICTSKNITERKRAEEALQESSQRLHDIIDFLPDATFVIDNDKKVIAWNRAMEEMTGIKTEDMLGKGDHAYAVPFYGEPREQLLDLVDIDNEELKQKYTKITRHGDILYAEVFVPALYGGKGAYVWATGAPLFDAKGTRIGAIESIRDITERKHMEESLKASEERLRTIINTSPDAIAISSIEGIIVEVTPRTMSMFGFTSPDEIVGRHIFDFMDPSYHEKALLLIGELLKGHYTGAAEYQMIRKDGSRFFAEANADVLRDSQGNPTGLLFVERDITERKETEVSLIESQRLATIGEMSSAIAHDFNNSLQSILGNIELAMISCDNFEKPRSYLSAIRTATVDAATRVQLLQRYAGQKQNASPYAPVDLNTLLDDVIVQSRPLWKDNPQRTGVVVSIIKNYSAIPEILGNDGELRSVFYNIVKNGIEAMPDGGTVIVETKVTDASVVVRITDSGNGMDEMIRSRMFQPFFSTKGYGAGRGMGLSSAYGIIKEHRGTIGVVFSAPGKGTIIEIVLPAFVSEKKEVLSERKKDTNIQASILWVEDEEMIRIIIVEMMRTLGVTVEVADCGETALKMLAVNTYDLVVTDIGMPGMSGWQLAERIKKQFSGAMPVVVASGWGTQIEDDIKKRYGVSHVVGKPFSMDQISDIITDILQQKRS